MWKYIQYALMGIVLLVMTVLLICAAREWGNIEVFISTVVGAASSGGALLVADHVRYRRRSKERSFEVLAEERSSFMQPEYEHTKVCAVLDKLAEIQAERLVKAVHDSVFAVSRQEIQLATQQERLKSVNQAGEELDRMLKEASG